MGYIYWKNNNNVVALTSDRNNGYSKSPYATFNQAYQVGDETQAVFLNRQKICQDHNLEIDHLVTAYQQHTDIIMKVDKTRLGCGQKSFESGIGPCDAMYTFEKGLAIGIFHADCVPIFIYAPKHGLVGIIHAGAIGTLKKVTYKALMHIVNNEKISPQDILVHIGPCLSYAHSIIKQDYHELINNYGADIKKAIKETSTNLIDIPLLNTLQIQHAGIPSSNISSYHGCTFENEELFYSFQRDYKTGRHLSIIFRP